MGLSVARGERGVFSRKISDGLLIVWIIWVSWMDYHDNNNLFYAMGTWLNSETFDEDPSPHEYVFMVLSEYEC